MMWEEEVQEEEKIISHVIRTQQQDESKGNLYLSGIMPLDTPDSLSKLGITCVLTIMDQWCFRDYQIRHKIESMQEIKEHKWIQLLDFQGNKIRPHLIQAPAYLKLMLSRHNVLVHCQMGRSRSASLVLAYLMAQHAMEYSTAKAYLQGKRSIIQPNRGFEKELIQYDRHLRSSKVKQQLPN